MADFPKQSFLWALAVAGLGMLLSIISIATPEWTVTVDKTIGLWVLKDNEVQYSWTNKLEQPDSKFFYSEFMQACRGMMMAGVMLAGIGMVYHLVTIKRKKFTMTNGIVLFGYYLLAALLLLIAATVYTGMIPQPLCPGYPTPCPNGTIVDYEFTGDYGYSLWLCWISGGLFLLPAAMVYEGGRQNIKSKKGLDLDSKVTEFRENRIRK